MMKLDRKCHFDPSTTEAEDEVELMIKGGKEQSPGCFHTGITYGNRDIKDL